MAAYIIVHMDYGDPSQIREYQTLAPPALAQHGIRLLGNSLDREPLEGTVPGRLSVLLQADSVEAASRSSGWSGHRPRRRPGKKRSSSPKCAESTCTPSASSMAATDPSSSACVAT